jgi:hypothetical protein
MVFGPLDGPMVVLRLRRWLRMALGAFGWGQGKVYKSFSTSTYSVAAPSIIFFLSGNCPDLAGIR